MAASVRGWQGREAEGHGPTAPTEAAVGISPKDKMLPAGIACLGEPAQSAAAAAAFSEDLLDF